MEVGSQAFASDHKTKKRHLQTFHHQKATIHAGRKAFAHASEAMVLSGVDVVSGGSTHFKSDGTFEEKVIQDVTQAEHKKKKKSTFGGRSKETRTSYTLTPIHTTVTSGKDILLEAQHDMTIRAPKLKSEGATTFVSHDGKVTMAAPKAVYVSTQTKKSKSAVWQSQQSKGRVGEEVSLAKILAKGGFFVQAAKGVEVDIAARKNVSAYLDRLESRPETSWIKVVRQIPGVKWHEIAEEHKKWNKKSQGLTPAASVVVALAIGVAIGCTGIGASVAAFFESATASVTVGAMAKGGFIALASQAGVFLLNNEGDLRKTFADLGRTESLTSLAIAMGSAGLLEGLTEPLSLPAQPTTVVEHLHVNAVQTGVSTSLAVPLQGADLVESLTDGVLATALNTATGYASTQIGQARVGEIGERGGKKVLVSGGLDGFTHKLLHALNGAALGAAVSRGKDVVASAAAGAIGSVGAELLGEYLMEDVIDRGHEPAVLREKLQQRADIAKLAATTGALVTGHDPAIASSAAETAVRHNGVESHLAIATLYAEDIEKIISGVEATGEVLATEIPELVQAKASVREEIDSVHNLYSKHPLTRIIPGMQFKVDTCAAVMHLATDVFIPTDVLGVGLTLPVVVGPVTKGASAAVQAGKQLVMGVERGLGRVLAVGAEALGESEAALQRLVQKFPSLSKGLPEVSYAGIDFRVPIGDFSRSTASALARKEATLASRLTATPSTISSSAPPPSAAALESMEFASLKVKPGPTSARERARAYSEKLRQEMKAMPKPFTSAPKPMSVASLTPPPSAAAMESMGTSLPQVRLNYQAGRTFQIQTHEHLRIPENHKVYSVLMRDKGAMTTRPDLPLPSAGVTDIKNVRYISFTKQLQAQAALAKKEGTSFNLIISPSTEKISKQLWDAVWKSEGKIFEFNPATEKMIERIVDGNKVLR